MLNVKTKIKEQINSKYVSKISIILMVLSSFSRIPKYMINVELVCVYISNMMMLIHKMEVFERIK